MTKEERVRSLHKKIRNRYRHKEYRKTGILGITCFCMSAGLFLMILNGTCRSGTAAGMYTASSILFDDVGGYVLTAVIAFMIGVVITVIIRKHLEKKEKELSDERKPVFRTEAEDDLISFMQDESVMMAAGGKGQDESKNMTEQNPEKQKQF